jgi:poly(hydroxyalkanoate) depolymerase family esterase
MSIDRISNTIEQALAKAGLDVHSGPTKSALETIRKALEAARLAQAAPAQDSDEDSNTIDVDARVVADEAHPQAAPTERAATPSRGRFLRLQYSGPGGSRAYKLYVPARDLAEPMPLVVMLHGCKQSPDDFAAGTRINELADAQGFLVAFPEQSAKANGSNCWNWFEPRDQMRHGAEPLIIAGIVREIAAAHTIDQRRVFVAGLSAGAAMAVILGETHPDVFAAVGAHSGLPYGAAHDVASAFAAMHGAAQAGAGVRAPTRGPSGRAPAASRGVPTIVFHGDRDATVALKNGAAIAEQARANLASETGPFKSEVQSHTAHGRRCTRTAYVDEDGLPWVEEWTVHGGGHAWSGGSAAGSFTETHGPDASREMMRFFMLHELRESGALEAAAT